VETGTGTFVGANDTGTNPLAADTDNDGRKDGEEVTTQPTTNPVIADTDSDTYTDGEEVAGGHNPNDANDNIETTAIANSAAQFSGVQGQDDWFWGYRNPSVDGGGENYNPTNGFIPFNGGDGMGDWDGNAQQWSGSQWDLNTAAAGPWTELGQENTHPNSAPQEHWTIRRWVANSITTVTPLAFRYHTHKSNTGCGNGVAAALYINGVLKDKFYVAYNDGTGKTHIYFANVAPGDMVDLILSPRGEDEVLADGCDGSVNRLMVDPTIPANPVQPDGSIFIPVGSGDTDADGIPTLGNGLLPRRSHQALCHG
jgi:hypothetical protein